MALFNDFLSLIYPRHCEACANVLFSHEWYLCNQCRTGLPRSNYHLYPDNPLARKFYGRVPFVNATSLFLFEKSGRVQRLLHAIKYQEQKELADHLGHFMAGTLSTTSFLQEIDVIVPIPLHVKKLQRRGFNQSEWFGRGLARGLNKPIRQNWMVRDRDSASQTNKGRFERWENVEGIFRIPDVAAVAGQHILLVDDVITTGATLEAAWQCLKEVKDVNVSLCSIAFAQSGGV